MRSKTIVWRAFLFFSEWAGAVREIALLSPAITENVHMQSPNLNFEQLKLGDGFELRDEGTALSKEERDARENAARAALIALYKGDVNGWKGENPNKQVPEGSKAPAWMEDLLYLLDHGWPWRQAVYIAWAASPRIGRWPETQEQLATQVLGLSSDRVIAEWRRKNPAIETMISSLLSASMMSHRGDVIAALKESAANPDYKNHPDRKLYAEMTGLYTPVAQVRALIASGKLRMKNDASELSDEELLALIEGGKLGTAADEASQSEDAE